MNRQRYVRSPIVLSVFGLALASALLLIVLKISAAAGPTVTPHPEQETGQWQEMQFYDPVRPPERPPRPTLLLNEGMGQRSSTRQPGVRVYHHWVVDGRIETRESKPPYSWPEPPTARSTDEVILDLGTGVMPHTVEVRLYDEVGPDGDPDVETAKLLICESGRLDDDDERCAMARRRDPVDDTWQLILPTRSWRGSQFLAVWAGWLASAEAAAEGNGQTPEYSAAWLFSLEITR